MTRARRWVRALLRSARLRAALCWAIQLYIRLVYATNRWTVEGEEWPRRLRRDGRGFIGSFWHGRLMMIPMGWQRLAPMHMLISAHRDGRIIADAITYFGVQSISGVDAARRLGGAAPNAEAARGRRVHRHHAGRAARSGDGRKHRDRQSRPAVRGADRPGRVRDEPAEAYCAPGTASISRCRLAAAFSFGASRSRSRPISMRPSSNRPDCSSRPE